LIGRQIYRVILPPFQAQLQIYREAQKDPAAYARNYDDLLGLKLALHNEDYTKAQQYKRNILARDKDFKF
jgi:hypothetical protein